MPNSQWTDKEIRQATDDHLSFDEYCQVMTTIALSADTPLTVGVFGPWGSGKTSLLRLVQEALQQEQSQPLTVWFNAWKYDKEDALWRALIIQVLNTFRPELKAEAKPAPAHALQIDKPAPQPPLSSEQEQLNRRLDDLEASLYRVVEREEIGGVRVDWEKLLKGSVLGLTHLSLSALPGVGLVLSKMMEEAGKSVSGSDLNTIFDAIQRERRKIYREHIRSLEQFQHNFEALVQDEVIKKNRRLVVFIDDLDRCLPEKAIEVLEALKLFLDAPGCVFFLGADREVIQRGIRVKYKDFLLDSDDAKTADRRIPIAGDNYLEKIVQLPFHLLPLDEKRVTDFIDRSGVDLSPGCAAIFAAGLEANPRKVKRALNIFRLLRQLAGLRQKEFEVEGQPVEIKPQLLAKIVVIQSRYSDLYQDLVEFPTLLQELERYARTGQLPAQTPAVVPSEPTPTVVDIRESQHVSLNIEPAPPPKPAEPTLLDKYRQRRPLQRLLSAGQDFFAELPLAEVSLYLYLTYTTEERRSGSEAEDTVTRRLEQLLSNDPTKVSSAVAAIQADETGKPGTVADFQRRLLGVIDQPEPATAITQRLSAGLALALLGDPRDFDEMIAIPPDQYPLGPNGERVAIEGFKIGKYPVTNAQYGEFLKANDGVLPPEHWDGRICPPALANHPVTRVNWAEAQAYCRWAGKFLPTAQQWAAAAFDKNADPPAATGPLAVPRLDSPTPVGLFPEAGSPLKVLDMIGNVWEWTQTAEGSDYSIRGGSWKDLPKTESTAGPETKLPLLGFRVAE